MRQAYEKVSVNVTRYSQ